MKKLLLACIACLLVFSMAVSAAAMKPGDILKFGRYEQDGNVENGKEPIAWIVLDYDSKQNRALLLSRFILDVHCFDKDEYRGWYSSDVRMWLNNRFLYDTFTPEERMMIVKTVVKTGDNSEWRKMELNQEYGHVSTYVSGGPDSEDRVFLLSTEEAAYYAGFRSVLEFYEARSDFYETFPTESAAKNGAVHYVGSEAVCFWILRSPAADEKKVAWITNYGALGCFWSDVSYIRWGIRPALWLDLSQYYG